MRLPEAFSPIEVGDADDFGVDFTRDVGGAYVLDTSWTCRLSRFSEGWDPDPQSRILTMSVQGVVLVRVQDGSVQQKHGAYCLARVGGMPATAAGATYVLDATAYLSDGRQISHNSTVQCVLPGQ